MLYVCAVCTHARACVCVAVGHAGCQINLYLRHANKLRILKDQVEKRPWLLPVLPCLILFSSSFLCCSHLTCSFSHFSPPLVPSLRIYFLFFSSSLSPFHSHVVSLCSPSCKAVNLAALERQSRLAGSDRNLSLYRHVKSLSPGVMTCETHKLLSSPSE